MANTQHMDVKFSPNGLQILSCGTDRKILYWEIFDGSLLREVEGSKVGSINCLDISPDGECFVTGSSDCLIKFWNYNTADITHVGTGHAAIITSVKFSPDSNYIVSASADGAVIIWKNPMILKINSAKSSKSSCNDDKSNRSIRSEENIGNISKRSNDEESIKTVHTSNNKIFNLTIKLFIYSICFFFYFIYILRQKMSRGLWI